MLINLWLFLLVRSDPNSFFTSSVKLVLLFMEVLFYTLLFKVMQFLLVIFRQEQF